MIEAYDQACHPTCWPSIRGVSRAINAAESSAIPSQSALMSRRCSPAVGSTRTAAIAAATPMGTFNPKTNRHPRSVPAAAITTPPTKGAAAVDNPMVAPVIASARTR